MIVMDRASSPAFQALRLSVRRLLAYVEQQVQQHGESVVLFDDELASIIGSTRIYISGLRELHALGLHRPHPPRQAQHHRNGRRLVQCDDAGRAIAACGPSTIERRGGLT